MRARTAFRLAMLSNGFTPLLNNGKRPVESGWPKQRVTEADVLAWDRSLLATTGMRIDGDLAVIDVDVVEPALVEALAEAMAGSYPELFTRGLVRHAGGVKEAWIARVDAPYGRLASWRWHRGGDPDNDPKQLVECFGSLATRQFAIDGPRDRDSAYQFTGGASPATTPRASLPVLPKAAYAAACNLFDEIVATVGLVAVKEVRDSGGAGVVYDLTDDMLFEGEGGAVYRLGELGDARLVAAHEGRDLRVSSSFLGYGDNQRKCIVGYAQRSRRVYIHDFETGATHLPANRKPIDDLLWERLVALTRNRQEKGDAP